MIEVLAEDPEAADVCVRFLVRAERFNRGIDHGGIQLGTGLVAGARRVHGAVGVIEQLDDARLIVQVDECWGGPFGRDARCLGVVTNESGYFVVMGDQFRQNVGSDEPSRARECDLHVLPPVR